MSSGEVMDHFIRATPLLASAHRATPLLASAHRGIPLPP